MTGRPDKLMVYLRLGRVSNLPTVWSNTIAGVVLAGGSPCALAVASLALAMTLCYVGGMFLNDAFDREIDARERPERPIPAGHIAVDEVFAIGFGLLAAGSALTIAIGGANAALPTVALATAIVAYDVWHKGNPASPLLMGICRMLVYVTAACASSGGVSAAVWTGAGVLLCWLIGLSYVAKQENLSEVRNLWPLALLAAPVVSLWSFAGTTVAALLLLLLLGVWAVRCVRLLTERTPGNIPRAVVGLIAGISLVDAIAIAGAGGGLLTLVAAAGFPLTLAGQRSVKGT
mgnify:CR=1 FL=1